MALSSSAFEPQLLGKVFNAAVNSALEKTRRSLKRFPEDDAVGSAAEGGEDKANGYREN